VSVRLTRVPVRVGAVAGLLWLVTSVTVVAWPSVAVAAPSPTVVVAPSATTYADGQTVTVSVGPNKTFVPYTRINVLECADPGGTVANLPTSFRSCDGNTVQGGSIIVQPDGSFATSGYTLYALPNAALGEAASFQPVCSPTEACVLFVGENQNDFSQPKVFSQPFTFSSVAPALGGGGSGSTSTPTPGTGGTGSGSSSASGSSGSTGSGSAVPGVAASASGIPGPSTLAFTGPPVNLEALAALGAALVGLGALGRLASRRRHAGSRS
jgi:hypothetical protein